MSQIPPRSELKSRLLEIIARGSAAPLSDVQFDRLARDVFQHQYARNPLYRRYCDARGVTPATLAGWRSIPGVPTDAFKAAPLLCGDPDDAAVVFRTSGTTAGAANRGEHYLLDTSLYKASLRAGFRTHLLPDRERIRILSLVPDFRDAPNSSLSFMITEVIREFGDEGSASYVRPEGLDTQNLSAALEDAERRGTPVLLAGTSFSFVHLLDELDHTARGFQLAPSSRAMDTGGFKGRTREVERDELYGMTSRRLGIPRSHIVNEYGMTEMSSQLYDGVVGTPRGGTLHRGPGWVRTLAVDPETLAALPDGETGILRHVDLANLDSVMALQTADLGRTSEGGSFELLGRSAAAEPRGCSIAMDELLSVVGRR